MFGYIAILQALYEREKTGTGKFVKASLFETCVFMMGQHMAYSSQVEGNIPPMPARVSAWAVYRIFNTKDEDKIFVGIISEKHWIRFCKIFGWTDWLADERLATNNDRITERDWFLPELEQRMAKFTKAEITQKCETAAIPFAPIARPEDLYEDQQLNEGNALLKVKMPNDKVIKLPKFPIEYGDTQVIKRMDPPKIGEHTAELLTEIGRSPEKINELKKKSIIQS